MQVLNRGALLFFMANFCAGIAHYLYQVLAARELSFEDFGALSGWLAWVYLLLSCGAIAQYMANFFPLKSKGIYISLALVGASALFVCVGFFSSREISYYELAALTLLVAPGFSWLQGQSQRRLMFWTFSVAGLIVGISKVLMVFFYNNHAPTEIFYWALPLSYVPGILFLGFPLWKSRNQSLKGVGAEQSQFRDRIVGALLLSFSSVFIPNVDLVYANWTQSSEVLAQMSQVSLIYKAIFFITLILAQWLLPHQLTSEESFLGMGRFKNFLKIFFVGLVFAFMSVLLGPWFTQLVLNKTLQASSQWIFLSCFNVSLLTGIFLEIQSQAARLKSKDAGIAVLFQIAVFFVFVFFGLSLEVYLQAQVLINLSLLLLLTLGAGGIFSTKFVQKSANRIG